MHMHKMMMPMTMFELLLMNTVHIGRHQKKNGHLMQGVDQEKGQVCTASNNLLQHPPCLN